MADQIQVNVNLNAKQAMTQLQKLNAQFATINQFTEKSFNSLKRTNREVDKSLNLIRLYAAAWIGVSTAMSALREIGTVQNLERAISTVTEGSKELNDTWDRLTEISLKTRSDLEANTILFQRLSFSTENLGATTEQVESTVVALAAGLRLGGATAQESASSLRQLSQAFSKGKLDGDEFRSVMENAGFLMVQFAKEIDVTVGELIEMSRQGKITSEVMLEGFAAVAEVMEEKLAKSARTVDDALNDLRTVWLNFVRSLEASGAAVAVIDTLRDSFSGLTFIIEKAREALVDMGLAESRTVNESAGRRIELMKELNNELEKLSDLERDRARIIPLFRSTEKDIQAQKEKVGLAAKELALETQRFAQLKQVAAEEEKIQKNRNDARAEIEKAFKADQARQKAMEEQAKKNKEIREFEREAQRQLSDALKKEESERKAAIKAREDEEKRLFEIIQVGTEPILMQKNALQEYAESIMTVEDVFVNAFKSMEDALVEFVMTGKLDFQSMVDSMIADIARLVIQQEITGPLAKSFGGLFGGDSTNQQSGSGLFDKLITGARGFLGFQHGGAFDVGGRSGVDRNLVAFRATKGERVTVTPRGQSQGTTVVMNINATDAESFIANEDQIMNRLQARLSLAQRNL